MQITLAHFLHLSYTFLVFSVTKLKNKPCQISQREIWPVIIENLQYALVWMFDKPDSQDINRLQIQHSRPLAVTGLWTQISVSCEWRDCAGSVTHRLDCFPLLPSEARRTHISRLRFNSFDINTKLTRASACWERLYLTTKDMCISKTVLMHKMSGVKQKEHRQKGVS